VGCTADGQGGYTCAGTCRTGLPTCVGGLVQCGGQVAPSAETCDGTDNDCNGVIDDGYDKLNDPANCGGCGVRCATVVTHGVPGCALGQCTVVACLPGYWDLNGDPLDGCEYACTYTSGGVERCGDGIDNDCDGQVDEGFDYTADVQNCGTCGNDCGTGKPFGTRVVGCTAGACQYACLADHFDRDGDLGLGKAGNGCEYGCVATNGGTEACDGLDNDCNGTVDEGFDKLGDVSHCGGCDQRCADQVGAHETVTGCVNGVCRFACEPGYVDVTGDLALGSLGNGCECPITNGGVEICDGLDNDCDGQIDEDAAGVPLVQACYTGAAGTENVGPCRGGSQVCGAGGTWGPCQGEVLPAAAETCDGVDNDCDGQLDEDAAGAPLAQACYTGPAGTENVGPCRGGSQACTAGAWGACTGQVTPQVETCDGADNDCDGQSDEDYTVATDPQNCGSCGYRCAAHVGAFSTATGCAAGACQFACLPNHYDHDGDVGLGDTGTGCEYACVLTNGGVERCGDAVDNDCDGQIDEGFDFTAEVQNCGTCGHACAAHAPFGTTATGCAGGVCQFACLPTYYDLNGDLAAGEAGNGCEYTCTVSNGGTEACDNLDNDCDGAVDEGFDKQGDPLHCGSCNYACAAHVGAGSVVTGCTSGVCQFACAAGFVDRNGDVSLGNLGNGCEYACTQSNGGTEICDGLDNDCDGQIDENASGGPLTESCYTGTVGTAGTGPCRTGTRTCQVPGGWTACTGEVTPQPETCDGIDNDCDGSTDEADLGGPLTRSCYTGPAGTENVGPCRGGSQTCSVGAWSACTGQVTPQVEACDGVDNDCDGTNNEGFTLATDMQNCGACGNRCTASVGAFSTATGCVGGVCQFACQAGHHDLNGDVALGASGTGCEYACVITNGGVERCGDGVDNDCDGQTDEGFTYTADPQNCGSCGYACASHTPFGTTSTGCASGTCQFTCLPSYYDLNGDLAAGEAGNGCEYTCTVSNGGTEACDSLDNDCDGTIDEGFDKQTSTAHCGSCNYACAAHVGAGSVVTGCTNGVCQFACASGFVDRNGDVSLGDLGNGCEYACAQTNGGTEICDGLDNDCDGAIDENATGGPLTETCYTGTVGTAGTGPCRTGTRTCQVPGGWTACTGEVTPQPESCDGIDNDCDGETDEASPGVPLTQACYTGPSGTQSHPPCKGGTQTCSGGAYGACVGQVTPQLEICDTVDNDCDGTNNEGFDLATDPQNCGSCGHQCSAHAGAFSTATGCVSNLCQYTCQPNHWDLDNNRHLGSGGNGCEYACIQTNGGVEACGDGVDNDCDGSIDEGFDLTTDANNCGSCGYVCASRTPPGATSTGCAASQCTFVCQAGRHDLNLDLALGIAGNGCEYSCTTTNGGVEICDNVDNDCNGVIDNGFDKQTSLDHCGSCSYACAAHAGAFSTATACVSGACQYTCQPGHYDLNGDRNLGSAGNGCEYACTVSNGGTEICDNVDNDCDGAIDESVTRACYGPGYGPATGCTAPGSCKGTCHEGIETCSAGVWQGCSGAVTPAPEICDTLDNDCDGVVNNGFDTTSDLNNCGGCNVSCWTTAPAHTYPSACVASVCQYACMSGYANLGGGPDCEYQCPVNPPTTEYCDGVDNDCDGLIDEGLTAPVGLCYQGIGGDGSDAHNPCLGVTALCQDPDGAGGLPHGWYCQYKASVERNPAAPNNLLGYETLCDGWDGDCDGTPDDNFGVGDICDNGLQGRCKVDGVVICDAGDPSTTECLLPPSAGWPDPEDEICDGVDNDCDGLTDENAHENLSATDPVGVQGFVVDSVVPIFVGGQKVFVYTYEASRPSATGATAGSGSSARACSKENVLPWANVTHAQAERACARAGLRLCQADEWFEACSGAVLAYPYGPAYNATACNGHDRDPAQDAVVATGSLATCDSVTYGIADLSGNLREWTNDVMGYTNAGKAIYTLRGGSYMDYSGGLGCGFEMSGFVEDVFAPNVGFRCCTTCGNDAVDPGETCEVGDAGCNPATCGPLTCGNGVLEVAQGEECDDGNLLPLDGCSPTCQREEESCSVLYPADEDGDGLANCADPSCAGTWCADMQDNDGDGFTEADGDCDDTNPNIHPAAVEICNDGIDNNCNGLVDRLDTVDADGDGQRRCHPTTASLDDCDDWDPTRSPRHLEKPGDGIDNDCDGSIDEAATACNNCTAGHTYADAIDACGWWVNSVTSNGDANGRGWRNDLANSTTIVPHKACSFLVMSSGHIDAYLGRGTGNNYVQEQGADLSNGNQSDPIEGTTNAFVVYDQVQVFMVLDVPTNVYSLSFDFAFFSAEYPEYVCTSFNDEFYAIIQSSHPDYNGFSCLGTMPAPPQTGQGCRNISFDGNGNKIGVNAAFFENPTSPGSMSLTGTGYEYYDDNANNCWGNLAGCVRPTYNCPDVVGGATNWLTTTANVVPGERIRLTFDIHDESDSQYDSRVVIDNFRWNFEAVSGPVTTK
jgi:hypothetical protein